MNECLVNMLYLMNSGDENLARQSFMSMGIILQRLVPEPCRLDLLRLREMKKRTVSVMQRRMRTEGNSICTALWMRSWMWSIGRPYGS